jgi:hypothetical protein
LIGNSEGTRPLGIYRRQLENNIEIPIKEIGMEYVNWIHLAQEWITVVKEVKEPHVSWN